MDSPISSYVARRALVSLAMAGFLSGGPWSATALSRHSVSRAAGSGPELSAAMPLPPLAAPSRTAGAHATFIGTAPPQLPVAAGPQQANPLDYVEQCIAAEMRQDRIYGAAMAIVQGGQIVFSKGYGRKHRDLGGAVDVDTQFRIGSSTKMMTAAGIMRLVDEGRVDLDAPVTTYLPDFELAEPGAAERITLRHLLQHTSGLHDTSALDESDLYGPTDPGAMHRWVREQSSSRPYAPPGTFYNYSSANYMYAGHVIEHVAGMSYPEYMARYVLGPAGMHDSTLLTAEVMQRGNYAFGHWWDYFNPGRLRIFAPDDQDNWARHPTGYVHSTVGDIARWMLLLMGGGGDVMSPLSADDMQAPHAFRHNRDDQYYGYGVFTEAYKALEIKQHGGGAWGWSASVDWVPARDFGVATLTNGGASLRGSAYCAIEAFLKPQDVPQPQCPRDRAAWPDYVGAYAGTTNRGDRWTFDVASGGGGLSIEIRTASGAVLRSALVQSCADARYRGPATFLIDANNDGQVDYDVTFIRDPDDPAVMWLRNRLFVGRKPPPDSGARNLYLPLLDNTMR